MPLFTHASGSGPETIVIVSMVFQTLMGPEVKHLLPRQHIRMLLVSFCYSDAAKDMSCILSSLGSGLAD